MEGQMEGRTDPILYDLSGWGQWSNKVESIAKNNERKKLYQIQPAELVIISVQKNLDRCVYGLPC